MGSWNWCPDCLSQCETLRLGKRSGKIKCTGCGWVGEQLQATQANHKKLQQMFAKSDIRVQADRVLS